MACADKLGNPTQASSRKQVGEYCRGEQLFCIHAPKPGHMAAYDGFTRVDEYIPLPCEGDPYVLGCRVLRDPKTQTFFQANELGC